MAKITIDNKTLSVDGVFERILQNTLTGNKTIILEEGVEPPVLPTFSETFTSLSVTTDDGDPIPVTCTYDKVKDYTSNFREEDRAFTYSIVLGANEK